MWIQSHFLPLFCSSELELLASENNYCNLLILGCFPLRIFIARIVLFKIPIVSINFLWMLILGETNSQYCFSLIVFVSLLPEILIMFHPGAWKSSCCLWHCTVDWGRWMHLPGFVQFHHHKRWFLCFFLIIISVMW